MLETSGDGAAPLLFALPGNEVFAARLASVLGGDVGQLLVRDFPDGESYVRVDTNPASRDVVIVATLNDPNEKTLPLIFLADALRDGGAARVGLVAPYLSYMRQDARFHPGEAITSRSYAAVLSHYVDWLLTVDPHLHRYAALSDVYAIPATAVHVATELGKWIAANIESPFIIGPDAESRQWVDGIAAAARAPSTVLSKTRRGDTDVIESIPELGDGASLTPVLVDDIISTGETMIAAIRRLHEQRASAPVCVAVHAVFAHDAYSKLRSAGASGVITTNTITHASNCIDVVPAIVSELRRQRFGAP
jgi:ribose-phosphate pyrophosphokinase